MVSCLRWLWRSHSSGSANKRNNLEGHIALVTGASRGVGRGIALQLGEAGATVYITAREPSKSLSFTEQNLPSLESTVQEINKRGGKAVKIYCDHSDGNAVKNLFEKVALETGGKLNILVNAAFSGLPSIEASAGKKFFECDPNLWDDINNVGLRNLYFCSVYASRMMNSQKKGLIVNISSAGGIQYFFNVPYGVGKAAIDRMSADMARELRPSGVAVVSLWPGTVKTELSVKLINNGKLSAITGISQQMLDNSLIKGESPEFAGRAVVALASDPVILKKSGRILLTADLASEYGFVDIDGKSPVNMRNLNTALEYFGWPVIARLVPNFVKLPPIALHISSYKF
ncbi:unnamed protein product [Dracunculus medinensis]|uniref:Dehydrogenase/reductase SDR family member 1 n=1 Tax=Dracunculus medinensis TaxID=318479 RepID=A0A0N4UNN3_DRAME|nr:unnamed protein product [Dracunculus medinensis]